MQDTRVREHPAVVDRRPLGAVVCAVLSLLLLVFLGFALYDMGDTYENITEGGLPETAAVVGLIAAGFGAGAASYWTRDTTKAWWAFFGVLVLAAAVYGVVWIII